MFYVQKLKTYIHNDIVYNSLTAPRYSRVGEHCAHGETETVELNTPKNSLLPFKDPPPLDFKKNLLVQSIV